MRERFGQRWAQIQWPSAIARTLIGVTSVIGVLGSTGCGRPQARSDDAAPTPNEPDAGAVDAPDAPDAPGPLGAVLRVTDDGDDAGDGAARPLRTLGRALQLAAAHPEVLSIELAAGRYDAARGETFPYVVPDALSIAGRGDGTAELVGDGAVDGLVVGGGVVTRVTLQAFRVAVTTRGAAILDTLDIRASQIGVHADPQSAPTLRKLTVTAAAEACSTAVEGVGSAHLDITDLTTTEVASAVHTHDQATTALRASRISATRACPRLPVVWSESDGALTVTDTEITGGTLGIGWAPSGEAVVQVARTNIHDATTGIAGLRARVTLEDVTLTSILGTGIAAVSGDWAITRAVVAGGLGDALYVAQDPTPATCLIVRDSTLRGFLYGISLGHDAEVDLGTAASPGHNTIQGHRLGLYIPDTGSARTLQAVGNTWQPLSQGADAEGHYGAQLLRGPVRPQFAAPNFDVQTADWAIQL